MKVLIFTTLLFVTTHSEVVPEPSTGECECQEYDKCNWSIFGVSIILNSSEDDPKSEPDPMAIEQAQKIQKYICNEEGHKVWCCGPEGLAPDFDPLPADFDRDLVLEYLALDRWGWASWAWDKVKEVSNKAYEAVKEAAKEIVDAAKNAWDQVMKAIETAKKLRSAVNGCIEDARDIINRVNNTRAKLTRTFQEATCDCCPISEGQEKKSMIDLVFETIAETIDVTKSSIDALECCIDGIVNAGKTDRGNNFLNAMTMTLSATVSGKWYQFGLAFEFTGAKRKLAFSDGCAGLKPPVLNSAIDVELHVGFWRSFDDITRNEKKNGASLGLMPPPLPPLMLPLPVEVGAGLVAEGLSLKGGIFTIGPPGVLPLNINFFSCEDEITKIWQRDKDGNEEGIIPDIKNGIEMLKEREYGLPNCGEKRKLENYGENCWSGCNGKQGKCDWCGSEGFCCKKGVIGDGCDGHMGNDVNHHQCSKNIKSKHLFGCSLDEGCKVAIKNNAHDNKYRYVRADGDEARVNSDQVKEDETWTVTFIGNHKVQFKSRHNKYMKAYDWDNVKADAPKAQDWETFTVEEDGYGYYFRTQHGKYWSHESDRNLWQRGDKGTWQKFEVEHISG